MIYLSLGAGVQSTALLVLSNEGKVPRADYCVFADTQSEPSYVMEYLEVLKSYSKIPIVTCTAGSLEQDILNSRDRGTTFASIPGFTEFAGKAGMLRRQCTREYKINPIYKKVRELAGYKPRQRIKEKITSMIGISWDERRRMKPSWVPYIENKWPLVENYIRRGDCLKIVTDAGLPEPKKSACYFCPYHDNKFWLEMKTNDPETWQRAVKMDHAVRNMTKAGIKHPMYLHPDCEPLDEVDLTDPYINQMDMFKTECEGMCGV